MSATVHHSLLLVQWQLRRSVESIPLLIAVQVFLSVATVVGYGVLVGDPRPDAALYLATGAPTIAVVTIGLVVTPQMVSQARAAGSRDWMRALPIRRGPFLAADLLVWTVVALPGMVLTIVAGAWWFDVGLNPTWWLPLAALLVSLTAVAVGYTVTSLMTPSRAMLVAQMLVFVVLLFSPISYPVDRMPHWLASTHQLLPIEPMSQVIRAGLAPDAFSVPGRSVVVLLAWCTAAVAGVLLTLGRRT